MDMNNYKEDTVPAQGSRSPRSRRLGSSVPAPPPSSSNDGQSMVCTAGTVDHNASAKTCVRGEGSEPPLTERRLPRESLTPSVSLTRLENNGEEFYSPCSASLYDGSQNIGPRSIRAEMDGMTPATTAAGREDTEQSDASTHASGMSVETSTDGREVLMLDSDGESIPADKSSKKRKRGRPPKGKNIASQTPQDERGESALVLPRSERRAQESVEDFLEELKNAPTQDLGAIIMEEMGQVWRVSKVSRGLKGELSGALKKASCRTRAAVQALLTRERKPEAAPGTTSSPAEVGKHCEDEIVALRLQLAEANRKLEELRGLLTSRRRDGSGPPVGRREEKMEEEDPSPSPPSPQPRAKRAKRDATRGRRVPKIMSSSEEEDSDKEGARRAPVPPTPQRPHLPPREEWPPALRPAIQGKRVDLDPLPQANAPAPVQGTSQGGELDLEGRIMANMAIMLDKWARSMGLGTAQSKKEAQRSGKAAAAPRTNSRPTKGEEPPQKGCGKEGALSIGQARSAGQAKTQVPIGVHKGPTNTRTESPVPWTTVVGRKAKKGGGRATGGPKKNPPSSRGDPRSDPQETRSARAGTKGRSGGNPPHRQTPMAGETRPPGPAAGGKKKRRSPRSAAVVLACPEGQYSEILRLARERVDIASLGIEALRPRRALTGALILEITGPEGNAKADALAEGIRNALGPREGVRVSRPKKMAEIRIKDLDDSVTKSEIVETICREGVCVRDEVTIGELSRAAGGLFTAWMRCPVAAANKLTNLGHLRVGWSRAKIVALEERPLQCYKCLRRGHVRAQCPFDEDRTGTCYRCGLSGHTAKGCTNPPSCVLCKDAGRKADHRLGGGACKAPTPKKRKTKGGGNGPPNTGSARPVEGYKGPPAPPPCASEGPKQPPQWDYVVPPLPCVEMGSEEAPREQRHPGPRVVAMEVVAPPRKENKVRKGGLEEPMDLEATNGH